MIDTDYHPIVLLSGLANLRETAVLVGTPYALAKPCGLDALLTVTRAALRDRIAPRPVCTFAELRAQ